MSTEELFEPIEWDYVMSIDAISGRKNEKDQEMQEC
jgi:hypothetical protein